MSEELKTEDNNVIMFPGVTLSSDQKIAPKIQQMLAEERLDDIDATVEGLFSMVMECLIDFGIEFDADTKDTFVKDLALSSEAFRSLLCKYYGLNHPLQHMADSIFISLGEGQVKYKTVAENETPVENT